MIDSRLKIKNFVFLPIFRVPSFMILQIAFCGKLPITIFALIGFLPSVSSLMILQRCPLRKFFHTVRKFALINLCLLLFLNRGMSQLSFVNPITIDKLEK